MISGPDMGLILMPLEKFFKKMLEKDQVDIYHDRLKFLDANILKETVDFLIDNNRHFPTPGEIKSAYRDAAAGKKGFNSYDSVKEGCEKCKSGWIYYYRMREEKGYLCSNPCAHCWTEHSLPLMTRTERDIYWACRRFKHVWVPDLSRPEPASGILSKEQYEAVYGKPKDPGEEPF